MRFVWYAEGRQFPDTLSSENRVLSDKVYDERDTKRGGDTLLRRAQSAACRVALLPLGHTRILHCSVFVSCGADVWRHRHLQLHTPHPLLLPDLHRSSSQRNSTLLFAHMVYGASGVPAPWAPWAPPPRLALS